MVSWGTNPGMCSPVTGNIPYSTSLDPSAAKSLKRALEYMGLEEGQAITEIRVQHVFIGSCTNSRIEDLREAAEMIEGKKVAEGVRAMVVPGSQAVKKKAEEEGLDTIFKTA